MSTIESTTHLARKQLTVAWKVLQRASIAQFVKHKLKAIFADVRNQVLLAGRPGRRWKQRVNSYPAHLKCKDVLHHVLEHGGDEASEVGRREFEAGVRVDLEQPHVEVLVNHEIVAKQLKSQRVERTSNEFCRRNGSILL